MGKQWYRFSFNGQELFTPLTAERAEELRAGGYDLQPSEPPADLAERLAPLIRFLLTPSRQGG